MNILDIYSQLKKYKNSIKKLIFLRKIILFKQYLEKLSENPLREQLKIPRNFKRSDKRNLNYYNTNLEKFSNFYYERSNPSYTNNDNKQIVLRSFVSEDQIDVLSYFDTPNIKKAIEFMPNNKVPSPSKSPIKLFKFWIDKLSIAFSLYFELIWNYKYTPKNWNLAHILPLYKNKGAKDGSLNYRPIALADHIRKVFKKNSIKNFEKRN